jgi:hypothetical protein
LLTDPQFHFGNHLTAPPTTASPSPSSSPSLSRYIEPLAVNLVPNETLVARLPPRQYLPRRLTTGWLKSTSGAALAKGGKISPASAHRPKGQNGPGHFLSLMGRVTVGAAQCNSVIFLFPIGLIQIKFKFLKFIGILLYLNKL